MRRAASSVGLPGAPITLIGRPRHIALSISGERPRGDRTIDGHPTNISFNLSLADGPRSQPPSAGSGTVTYHTPNPRRRGPRIPHLEWVSCSREHARDPPNPRPATAWVFPGSSTSSRDGNSESPHSQPQLGEDRDHRTSNGESGSQEHSRNPPNSRTSTAWDLPVSSTSNEGRAATLMSGPHVNISHFRLSRAR